MDVHAYLEEMTMIQENLLEYLDNESNTEELYQNLTQKFNDKKIRDSKYKLQSLLHLISKIVKNHHRLPYFFMKIEKIILIFKEDLKKYFLNSEIFNIFKSNKRILLFLIENNLMTFDEYIVKKITLNAKYVNSFYPQYFKPEILPYKSKKWFPKYIKLHEDEDEDEERNAWVKELEKDLPEDFEELRKNGENSNLICKLIREDNVKDFIVYINKNNYSLENKIEPSIYETNSFLLQENIEVTLIEYTLFFGSIQIFNYLKLNGVVLHPISWLFSIHGQNAELIHNLEDNHIDFFKDSHKNQVKNVKNPGLLHLKEAIKCHHNNIFEYFINNFSVEDHSKFIFIQSLKHYNFAYLKIDLINESSFEYLCKYDHCIFVSFLLKENHIDVNHITTKIIDEDILERIYDSIMYEPYCKYNDISPIETEIIFQNDFTTENNESNNKEEERKYLGYNIRIDNNEIKDEEEKSFDDEGIIEKSPLFYAVEKENVEIVKLLLTNDKLDINIKNKGFKFLKEKEYQSLYKRYDFSDPYYNDSGRFIDLYKKTVLYLAVQLENVEIVKLLILNDKLDINLKNSHNIIDFSPGFCYANVAFTERTAFNLAVQKSNLEITKLLLENEKLDINISDMIKGMNYYEYDHYKFIIEYNTVLNYAVERENIEIIKLLLNNNKLDINAFNFTRNITAFEFLRKSSIDGEHDHFYSKIAPLYLAVEKENIEIINLFLKNSNLDVNIEYISIIKFIFKIPNQIFKKCLNTNNVYGILSLKFSCNLYYFIYE